MYFFKQHEAITRFYLHLVPVSKNKNKNKCIKSKVRVVDQWFRSRYWTITIHEITGR